LEEVVAWVNANRNPRPLNCSERLQYNVEPACDLEGNVPTPSATSTPSVVAVGATPTNPTPAPLLTWTPSPGPSPIPSSTPTLTAIQVAEHIAQQGSNRAFIPVGGPENGIYQGGAGETLTVRVNADYPANGVQNTEDRLVAGLLDTLLTMYRPNGA